MLLKTPSPRRLSDSPLWKRGKFRNIEPTTIMPASNTGRIMRRGWEARQWERVPSFALPTRPLRRADFGAPDATLAYHWLGHSSFLLELEGRRFLVDPVFSQRVSFSQLVGPRRFFANPLPPDQLPPLDAVLLSHDHYDHLDEASVMALLLRGVAFHMPLGVGKHLRRWGVPDELVHEHDWWEGFELGGLRVVAGPARHFSGRGLADRDRSLWASWSFIGKRHRVFYSGDTGRMGQWAEIAQRLGPFDWTLMQMGAYDELWHDIHLFPEEALDAHQALGARRVFPLHWGTFNLALHPWDEPIRRFVAEAERRGIDWSAPQPGQRVTLNDAPSRGPWWEKP